MCGKSIYVIWLSSSRFKIYFFLIILVFLFYGNSLKNGFVYDDRWLIQDNSFIANFNNLPKVFSTCHNVFSTNDQCKTAGLYYRPFILLQFLLLSHISTDPLIFHLTSLLFFVVAVILGFEVFVLITGNKVQSFVGAVLVAAKPVNSEVVDFASAIIDLHLVIFFLFSFFFYIKFSKGGNLKYLIFSGFFYFLTALSKESGVLLLFIFPVYELLYGNLKKKMRRNVYRSALACFILPLLLYFLLRTLVVGNTFGRFRGYHDLNFRESILTALGTFPKYINKLFYPLPLNAQHDPVIYRSFDLRIVFWLFVLFAVLYLALWSWRRGFKEICLGICLILIPILPVLVFINNIGRFIFAERWLFLATFGWSLCLVSLWRKLGKRKGQIALLVFGIYLVSSFLIVFNRNRDWHDELSFNKGIARLTKSNAGVWYNLGVNYSSIGDNEQAEGSYQKALEIDPNFWEAHNNLANVYLNWGRAGNAMLEYRKVLAIDPENAYAKTAIQNLQEIKSGNSKLKLVLNKIDYRENGLAFTFPVTWRMEEKDSEIILYSSDTAFSAKISRGFKSDSVSIGEYVKQEKLSGSELINAGPAKIPNFASAYAKIWKDEDKNGPTKLEFFLFEGQKVVKVLASDANSAQIKVFEEILASISIDEEN